MPITVLISPFEMDFKKGGGRECFREGIEIDFFFFYKAYVFVGKRSLISEPNMLSALTSIVRCQSSLNITITESGFSWGDGSGGRGGGTGRSK